MEINGPENRLPIKITTGEGLLQCRWLNFYDKRFTEPFFDGTIATCRVLPYREPPQVTGLDEIELAGVALGPVVPLVIIFHLSRCGSTLTTQLFASSGRFIVLSEVPVFDDILGLPLAKTPFSETKVSRLLSASLNLYGRKRYADEAHVVIKTDCWHIFFYHTLRKMFPAVPFVMMYRRPDEVFRSLNQVPGRQIIPDLVDPKIFGLPGMPDPYIKDIYMATILEKMLAKFLEVAETDTQTLLVNYKEGPVNIVKKIAAFANLELSEDELAVMEVRSCYHSKKPDEIFDKEPAAEIPPCLDSAMRLYDALEQKRKTT
jgi:hypothetical protein